MSFKYTVTESEEQRENLLDGDYVAVIRNIEEKMDKYGSYVLVEEELLSPVDVQGRKEFERFYTGAYDEEKQKWGNIFFSRMCKQLLGVSASSVIDSDALIGKHFTKTVKNEIAKNGKAYQNTTNRVLIEGDAIPAIIDKTVMYGKIALPNQAVSETNWPVDDEVPF